MRLERLLDIAQTDVAHLVKQLATLARESIERDALCAKLEAEVIAMRYQVPQWIAVDDWLPDEETTVLCFVPINHCRSDKNIIILHRSRYVLEDNSLSSYCMWFYDDGDSDSEFDPVVTHWMPLPDAPKEANDE